MTKQNRIVLGKRVFGAAMALSLALSAVPFSSSAVTNCQFKVSGSQMKLKGDCTTDSTILIPNGFTLDGQNNKITAMDAFGGHFLGAVIKNAGAVANVKDLKISGSFAADVCDAGDDRLRGILFDGASGNIESSNIDNIRVAGSGCQEGNAIEVRNAPFDGTHPATKTVTIKDNTITNYQKGGIIINGDVDATVKNNKVTGLGPVNYIAQNGIQLGFGAMGTVKDNKITGNMYSPATFASGGILVITGGSGITVKDNQIDASDVGLWLAGGVNATIKSNKVKDSVFDGIALDDQGGAVTGATVKENSSVHNQVGIGLYGSGVLNNLIKDNTVKDNVSAGLFVGFGSASNTLDSNLANQNLADGISVQADFNTVDRNTANDNGSTGMQINGNGNSVRKNTAKNNGGSDVQNTGVNFYAKNTCGHSSGAPVDCGHSPLVAPWPIPDLPTPQPFGF